MAKKKYFEPVDPQVDFPKMEREILDNWYKKGIVERYLKKNKNSKKTFSFLDGPITANNPMGVHHAWGRTYKDLWQRYFNMKGFRQRFQNGFDCQGLWVEVEVEKELGLKTKKDIENLVEGDKDASIKKFVDLCKERVNKYASIMTQQSKRLGYFMDWDNSYLTMSDENNYMIWHVIKVCHENGWLYKGNESVPWCPRCQTAISQHEILTEDYKQVTHQSVIVKFKIKGKKDEYLLVWTTTPWTIPANIAIAVDENIKYAKVKDDGKYYYLALDAIEYVFGRKIKPLQTFMGKELVGISYQGPFDDLPAVKKVAEENVKTFHKVIATDERLMPVTTEEGTGLVHTAVSAGTEDFRLGKKLGLPMIPVIDDSANYLQGLDFLSGENAKKQPGLILDYLEKNNWAFKIFDYQHRYPVCWRCKEELVWKVTDEWYIAMDKKPDGQRNSTTLRKRMIEVAKKIKWIPEFGLEREIDWLKNMNDWLISKKNRYWGLCLPLWECEKCSYYEVIGSYQELKEKAYKGWSDFEGKSPHKPQVDKVKIKCSKCGSLMSRIEPVGNPWLDAGIVSFSTIKKDNQGMPLYQVDKDQWLNWFPADFITESFPGQFKNWFYSLIAMSSVLENTNPFKTVLGYATLLDEKGQPMHKSSGNMIEFNQGAEGIGVDVMRWMYLKQNPTENLLFGYSIADEVRRKFHLRLWNIYNFFITYANLEDWSPKVKKLDNYLQSKNILDRWIVNRLVQVFNEVEKGLNVYDACHPTEEIEEFVNDLSNWYLRRSRKRAQDKNEKDHFFETLFFVLNEICKLLAPLTPFISEIIYCNLTKQDSVHLADWPDLGEDFDSHLINEMKTARDVVEKIHAQRKEKLIPVRQALTKVDVTINKTLPQDIDELILEEVNIKKILWLKSKSDDIKVKIDTKLTKALLEEAKARQLIRKIQNKRKEMKVDLKDKIIVYSNELPKNKILIDDIKASTYAVKLFKGEFKVTKA